MPVVTYALILLNVLAFVVELSHPDINRFLFRWGAIPIRIANWRDDPDILFTLVSSTFLHGGWLHLIGNMIYLSVFGDNVEDSFGHVSFLIFYLASGAIAGLVQVWFIPGSPIPSIGASGAVAAVLGAYLVLYPGAIVTVVVPILFIPLLFPVPAIAMLVVWFISQLFNGVLSLSQVNAEYSGGVAWWAHIGGFLTGIIIAYAGVDDRQKYSR